MSFPPPIAGFMHFLPGVPSRNKNILKKLYVSEKNTIEKYRGGGGVKFSIETKIYRNCNTSCGIFEQ